MPHRQRGPATCVTIQPGQGNAGHANGFMKGFGDINRVLTSHRVRHQQNFMRVGDFLDIAQFRHQGFVDAQPPCGIQNQNIMGL